MQIAATDLVTLDAYFARPSRRAEIRLARWRPMPMAVRRVLLAGLRVGMGMAMGGIFAAGCGNAGFWVAAGAGLGAVLDAVKKWSELAQRPSGAVHQVMTGGLGGMAHSPQLLQL